MPKELKVPKKCGVETCDRPARTRGYCSAHAQRLRMSGDLRPHIPIYREWERGSAPATRSPTTLEIAWAAGFLDGEGSFQHRWKKGCGVTGVQKDPELLYRLLEMFGGIVRKQSANDPNSCYTWTANGARARGVMMTLYKFLSKRRQEQVRKALLP